VSESTAEAVKGRFLLREIGAVPVKGKALPVKIFTVLPSDIRKHPRATLQTAATIIAMGGGRVCEVRTRDVSEAGIAIAGLPRDWPDDVDIEIRCEGGELAAPVTAHGTIVWRREDLAGIAFTEVLAESAPALNDYVSGGRAR